MDLIVVCRDRGIADMAFVGLCLQLLSFKLDAAFQFAAEWSDVLQVVLVRFVQDTGNRLLQVIKTRLSGKPSK